MAKSKKISSHDNLFFDRLLLVSLVLSATAYIFQDEWLAPVFTIGAVFTGVLWSYRTATNHPDRGIRLGAALIFALLGIISVYYLGILQNRI